MPRWIVPVLVLPGTALAFVPALIIWWTRDTHAPASLASTSSIPFWLGLAASRV